MSTPLDAVPVELSQSSPDYFAALLRAKVLVVVMALAGGAAGYLWSSRQTPLYKARTSIEIQDVNPNFLNLKDVNPVLPGGSYESSLQSQVRMLQSGTLLKRALAKLAAAPDKKNPGITEDAGNRQNRSTALAIAAGTTSARVVTNSPIVEIACDSSDPAAAADFLNTLVSEYIAFSIDSRWAAARRTSDWLTSQLADLKGNLEGSERRLQAYIRSKSLVMSSQNEPLAADGLRQLQQELTRAQADIASKRSRFEIASTVPVDSIPEVVNDNTLHEFNTKITELKRQLVELRSAYTPAHYRVKRVEAQLAELETARDRQKNQLLGRIHNEYLEAQKRAQLVALEYERKTSELTSQSDGVVSYNLLKAEVDNSRSLYTAMLQRVREANVAAALRANNINVIEPAQPSPIPYKPTPVSTAMMGSFAGTLTALVLVVCRIHRNRSLESPRQAAVAFNIAELGVIPKAKRSFFGTRMVRQLLEAGPRLSLNAGEGVSHSWKSREPAVELVTWQQKDSAVADSFRAALVSVVLSGNSRSAPKVVVLTSPGPREGKTTVASNLALAMAEINRRVLLIEADVRRPALHKLFHIANERGLMELLAEPQSSMRRMLFDFVVPTGIPNLHLLPCGHAADGFWESFCSDKLKDLLEVVKDSFDLVLIDTAPLLVGPDARLQAQAADGVVLVLRAGASKMKTTQAALSQLAADRTPVLGTIFNDWDPTGKEYAYDSYARN